MYSVPQLTLNISEYIVGDVSCYLFDHFNDKILELSRTLLEFMCGICAGCCSATLVAPIEVIRVRQMLIQEQYRGFINGAKAVYNSGGVLAFYEGWTAGVLMVKEN